MSNHDEKGRFKKGNKASSGDRTPVELRRLKNETKESIITCAHSLTRPWATLKDELKKKKATRLEVLLGHAISKKDHRFIRWLVEMAIGKPKQVVTGDEDSDQAINIHYKIVEPDGND